MIRKGSRECPRASSAATRRYRKKGFSARAFGGQIRPAKSRRPPPARKPRRNGPAAGKPLGHDVSRCREYRPPPKPPDRGEDRAWAAPCARPDRPGLVRRPAIPGAKTVVRRRRSPASRARSGPSPPDRKGVERRGSSGGDGLEAPRWPGQSGLTLPSQGSRVITISRGRNRVNGTSPSFPAASPVDRALADTSSGNPAIAVPFVSDAEVSATTGRSSSGFADGANEVHVLEQGKRPVTRRSVKIVAD